MHNVNKKGSINFKTYKIWFISALLFLLNLTIMTTQNLSGIRLWFFPAVATLLSWRTR